MPLGDPYLPQPSPEMILEEWKNLYMPKEARPEKQPVCIHKSVCTYVDRNTFCFYERKGIRCVHYFPKSEGEIHDYLANPTGSSEMMGGTTL